MKKQHFFLLVFIICIVLGFTQNKGSRPAKDTHESATNNNCGDIINRLRELHENDSIAIEIFKSEYKIYYLPIFKQDSLLKQNYLEIIQFFNSEESSECQCDPKVIRTRNLIDRPLIDNR